MTPAALMLLSQIIAAYPQTAIVVPTDDYFHIDKLANGDVLFWCDEPSLIGIGKSHGWIMLSCTSGAGS
jgi:hypothetical protein